MLQVYLGITTLWYKTYKSNFKMVNGIFLLNKIFSILTIISAILIN